MNSNTMSALSTPKASKVRPDGPQSPSLKTDGISISKNHLPRSAVVQEIYSTAKKQQYVVIGSSAATGKTSLLQLLKKRLEEKGANVIRLNITDEGPDELIAELALDGIVKNERKLRELCQNNSAVWLLLDDAQNAYAQKYARFWQFVVKGISSYDIDNLFVVIAATYDLSTPKSPVNFRAIEHIDPNISENEARELFKMHAEVWGYEDWKNYLETLVAISKFAGLQSFHVGVVMAGIRVLNELRKEPSQRDFNEQVALSALRDEPFINHLNRCFKLPDDLPRQFKDRLLDAVVSSNVVDMESDPALAPFIRAGLLTRKGAFSCIAARWYYNRRCFPNRATSAPESLDELIMLAVSSISAKRLRDTLVNGFPKEATFQHLFNEALSLHLPFQHIIIPELNTFAEDSNGSDVTGELDFYINGDKQWCLELLRNGDKIGEHIARFDEHECKYRKVVMKDYLVVDCRGPKKGGGARTEESRCTLYFSEDFKKCLCQMRNKEAIEIELKN